MSTWPILGLHSLMGTHLIIKSQSYPTIEALAAPTSILSRTVLKKFSQSSRCKPPRFRSDLRYGGGAHRDAYQSQSWNQTTY